MLQQPEYIKEISYRTAQGHRQPLPLRFNPLLCSFFDYTWLVFEYFEGLRTLQTGDQDLMTTELAMSLVKCFLPAAVVTLWLFCFPLTFPPDECLSPALHITCASALSICCSLASSSVSELLLGLARESRPR